MKRNGLIFLIALMVLGVFAVPAFGAGVQVVIDGQAVNFPDQQPYIDGNDRTLVPMRAPMEVIECEVEWNDSLRQAIIRKGDIIVSFVIGSQQYTINNETKTMDTEAIITGDRTCIPIRYAAEAVGATVGWDNASRTVGIATAGGTPVEPEPGYYTVRGYTIPNDNDFKEVDADDDMYNRYPVITIALNGDTLEAYQEQAKQARDVIASKHGQALADEMYSSLMEKEGIYQIINWRKVTPDNQYRVESDVCCGYAAYITVYVNQ